MAELEADLHLPWVRLKGEKKEGPPRLNAPNLFLTACREAFRSGSLNANEKLFLSDFAKTLALPAHVARGLAKMARQESDEGKLPGSKDLDAKIVFKKACALAEAKGEVDPEERQLLGDFSVTLGVPMMRANSTIRQMAVRIESVRKEPVQEIKLARDRNIDGSESKAPELEEWGDGDPLTKSGVMRLGVDIPRMPGGVPPPRKPSPPKTPGLPRSLGGGKKEAGGSRTTGFLMLGFGLSAVGLGLYGFRHTWFFAESPSVPMMFFSGLGILLGTVLAPWGAYRIVKPATGP